jgi:NAD+ kinase
VKEELPGAWGCVHSRSDRATEAYRVLTEHYAFVDEAEAEALLVLGGDGFMLQTLHGNLERGLTYFGMNRGTVGFLMNDWSPEGVADRLAAATSHEIHPLRVHCNQRDGGTGTLLGINEISAIRTSAQSANLQISVDGRVEMEKLVCDGLLVATPAGSTAYNLSAHGPVLPLDANLLALTPLNPFRPRRWRGALLPREAEVHIEVLDPDKRPVGGGADGREITDLASMDIAEATDMPIRLAFDTDRTLSQRILREQFE